MPEILVTPDPDDSDEAASVRPPLSRRLVRPGPVAEPSTLSRRLLLARTSAAVAGAAVTGVATGIGYENSRMSTRNEVELTEALRESFEAGMKQGRTQEADRAAYASYRALTLTVDLNRPSTKVGPVVSAMVFNGTVFEPTSVGENSCRFPIFLGNLPELEQNLGRPFGVEDLQEAWWGTQVSLVDQVGVASGRFAEGSRFVPDSEGDTLRSINLIRTEVEVGPDRFHTLAQGYNSETGQPLDVIPAMK